MGREKYSYWTEEEDRTLKEVFSQYVPDKERVEKKPLKAQSSKTLKLKVLLSALSFQL